MAIIYSYPTAVPKLIDKIIITQSYDVNAAAPIKGNPTRAALISDIVDLTGVTTGTANTLPIFTGTGLANSIITQNAAGAGISIGSEDSQEVTIEAILNIQGPVKDAGGSLGSGQQVLVSNASGGVSWGAYTTGTVKGTGAVNFVPKWSATDTLQDSIIFDNGTKVGIGTATPSGLLEIKGAQPTLYISNTTTATESNLTFQTINSAGTTYESFGEIRCGEVAGASGSGNRMRLGFVGGTGRAISIAPNGVGGDSFVGIGTDSPDNNLDVIGGISAQKDGQVFNGKPVTGLASAITEFSNSTGSLEPRIKLVNSTGTTKIVLDGANSPDGGVVFNTTLDVVNDSSVPGAAATITNNSESPVLRLVQGGSGNFLECGNAGASLFSINSQGHIGIGVNNASGAIQAKGIIRADAQSSDTFGIVCFNSAVTAASGIYFNNDNAQVILKDSTNVVNVKITSDSDSFFKGGKVGIGTDSPASKLTVNGGDIEVEDENKGLILHSPNNTRYRITVANDGTLSTAAL